MEICPLRCFKDWLAEQAPYLRLEMPEPAKLKVKRWTSKGMQYLGTVYVGIGGDWLIPQSWISWPPEHSYKELDIKNPDLFPLLLSYIKRWENHYPPDAKDHSYEE